MASFMAQRKAASSRVHAHALFRAERDGTGFNILGALTYALDGSARDR